MYEENVLFEKIVCREEKNTEMFRKKHHNDF